MQQVGNLQLLACAHSAKTGADTKILLPPTISLYKLYNGHHRIFKVRVIQTRACVEKQGGRRSMFLSVPSMKADTKLTAKQIHLICTTGWLGLFWSLFSWSSRQLNRIQDSPHLFSAHLIKYLHILSQHTFAYILAYYLSSSQLLIVEHQNIYRPKFRPIVYSLFLLL